MTYERIQHEIAKHFGLSRRNLLARDRHKTSARARQLAILICRDSLGMSYPELGRAFGNRDHTTAMSAVRKARRELSRDGVWRDDLRSIHRAIMGPTIRSAEPTIRYRVAV